MSRSARSPRRVLLSAMAAAVVVLVVPGIAQGSTGGAGGGAGLSLLPGVPLPTGIVLLPGGSAGGSGGASSGPATGTPTLPDPPQLGQLPGVSSLPDLSTVPGTGGLPGGGEVPGVTNSAAPPVDGAAAGGQFSDLFRPPVSSTDPACPYETEGTTAAASTLADITCTPAAVNMVLLSDGRILYWDGLEGEENVQYSAAGELGDKARDDQSRLLSLLGVAGAPRTPQGAAFAVPVNPTGGVSGNSGENQYLVPNAPGPLAAVLNDINPKGTGALFCSDQVQLFDGEILTPGGSDYYSEPRLPGTPYGLLEIQGLDDTRLFDPATDSWSVTSPMHQGRWYPSLVTLPNGSVFVASGVTKLIKPVYTSPKTALMSGRNVVQTEVFDPVTAKWTQNPSSADRSLPLYPRLHLLPDGNVYYDAGGEVFNPFGEAYDEALWNVTASYNPATKHWTNLGVPVALSLDLNRGLAGVGPTVGFRGSTFSVMLPLHYPYTSASFLSAGGTLGATPGSYLATTTSSIDTVTMSSTKSGAHEKFSSTATGPLVNARWFSTAVALPTGQVLAFNGDNRDDVVGPGTTFPVAQTELFDPATGTWTPMASTGDPRGYHNTAILLPSGQVLVGGSAPISALDMYSQTLPGGFANNWRDPSFQIYDPPYLHWGYAQPQITSVSAGSATSPIGYGSSFSVGDALGTAGDSVAKVVLVRDPADTHVVDGDQRNVELPFTDAGGVLTVSSPPNGSVAPPGNYMLFVDEQTPKGLVPSYAVQVWVGGSPDHLPPGLR